MFYSVRCPVTTSFINNYALIFVDMHNAVNPLYSLLEYAIFKNAKYDSVNLE